MFDIILLPDVVSHLHRTRLDTLIGVLTGKTKYLIVISRREDKEPALKNSVGHDLRKYKGSELKKIFEEKFNTVLYERYFGDDDSYVCLVIGSGHTFHSEPSNMFDDLIPQ